MADQLRGSQELDDRWSFAARNPKLTDPGLRRRQWKRGLVIFTSPQEIVEKIC
jgi:hypothetical protein